jgi:hypothetical protein
MNSTKFNDRLYQVVPAVYRNRDSGDLKKYFQGSGLLLDQIYATLVQRLADNFPDNPVDGSPACQDWLIPYFADLLDVRLVSPSVKGRRDEVANAVRWRQGKGTLRILEEIAESVGRLEAVLHEGWQRVAVTPRLDLPRIRATGFGYPTDVPNTPPSLAARHPGLPAVTVDFRCPSAALASDTGVPGAQQATVDGDTHVWRQASYHGVPCYPNSYEDVSRRSVDIRCGDWRVGHYHPKRVLLHTVPPAGFFQPGLNSVNWSDEPDAAFLEQIEVFTEGDVTTYRNKTFGTENYTPMRVRGVVRLGETGGGSPDFHTWRFQGLIFNNTLQLGAGRVELDSCTARRLLVQSIDTELPVVDARSCLFRTLVTARGIARLEYCTLLDAALVEVPQASDCIFLGPIRKNYGSPEPPDSGCLRYSRVVRHQPLGGMELTEVTQRTPVMYSMTYGRRGCGVLHPATPKTISRGAEDGGEMGAYHDDYLSVLAEAVVDKLADYMPVGLHAVVVPDPRLIDMPG